MIEQVSNPLMVVAFFADSSGNGVTGLTVTVDAWRIANVASTPTPTQILTNAAATSIGGGFYARIIASADVTIEAEYAALFKTTSVLVRDKQLPAMWSVNVAGVENLDSTISGVQSDTNDIQTRLPAALVSGRMDSSVGAMAANTLTATAIQDDAITAAKIAANAIGSSELATSAVDEIADAVWDEQLSGHLSAGSTGLALDTAEAGGGGGSSLESIEIISLDGVNLVPYGSMISSNLTGSITDVVVPARATHIAVQAVDEDIWYTDDGTDPTEDHGMVIYAGQAPRMIRLDEYHNDQMFRFLRSADGSSLRYRYYRPE